MVEQQNWKPFLDRVQQAKVYLEKYKDIASSDPYWYELMAIIAYAQDGQIRNSPSLCRKASSVASLLSNILCGNRLLRAKVGGSILAIEQFAREGLERTRSTEGFAMYARIYWYASQTEFGDRLFSESLVDWTAMKKGIDDVLTRYPDGWNINNFAKFACLSKDKAKTAELIGRINDAPLTAVWGDPLFFQQCKVWASSN